MEKLIDNPNITTETKQSYLELIEKGKEAEKVVIAYTDTLITAMNTRQTLVENEIPNPHPCSIHSTEITPDLQNEDYENLINCCQRHVCRSEGYCKSAS